MNPLFPLDRQPYYDFIHTSPTTHMHINPVTISHTEYASTWFLIGILVTALAALIVHIRNK